MLTKCNRPKNVGLPCPHGTLHSGTTHRYEPDDASIQQIERVPLRLWKFTILFEAILYFRGCVCARI